MRKLGEGEDGEEHLDGSNITHYKWCGASRVGEWGRGRGRGRGRKKGEIRGQGTRADTLD